MRDLCGPLSVTRRREKLAQGLESGDKTRDQRTALFWRWGVRINADLGSAPATS